MFNRLANLTAISLVLSGLILSAWVFSKTPAHGRTDLSTPDSAAVAEIFDNFLSIENYRIVDEQGSITLSSKVYDLNTTRSVDLVHIDPADDADRHQLALSFGFEDGSFLTVKLIAESAIDGNYSLLLALFGGYDLQYVAGDESAILGRHSHSKNDSVFVYKIYEDELFAKQLLSALSEEWSSLQTSSKSFFPLGRNSRNALMFRLMETGDLEKPISVKTLMPSYSTQIAYDLHLLDTTRAFSEVKRSARLRADAVNLVASDFSSVIRNF